MNRVCALVFFMIALISISFFPLMVSAQTISADLSIDVIPTNPEPGATVTLIAKSYGADLSQASLTWTYNNVTIAQGVGKTTIGVIAPANGMTGVVNVTAAGFDAQNVSASVVLRPASIDMLWEAADAYTPPFYKGKALLPVNGLIRFTAIPSAVAPKGLSYTWSRNGSTLSDESGYNKSSIVFKQSEFTPQELVEVSATGAVFSGSGISRLSPLATPSLIIYQNKGGFIDYANGYDSIVPFTQSGIVLHFEPYYFSVARNVLADLNFDLTIDGQTVTPSKRTEVGLSRPASEGQSTLALLVTPIAYSLQHIEKTFTLLFN